MNIERHNLSHRVEITTITLDIPLEYKQQCINEAYKIGDSKTETSNIDAISSGWHVWEETEVYNKLLHRIMDSIATHIPYPDKKFGYKLRNAWSNVYKKHHYAQNHHHMPCYLSWVYYLKANQYASPLVFEDLKYSLQPKDDLLVVFPSYVWHKVDKQTDEEDRICLAGNIIVPLD